MEIALYDYEHSPKDLIEAEIRFGTRPEPYAQSASIIAASPSHVDVYLDEDAELPFNRAGRILAQAGIFRVRLITDEISPWDALAFLNGLYAGTAQSITASFNLSRSAVKTLSWIFASVCAGREFADLGSAQCEPVPLVNALTELCGNAAKLAGGRVTSRVITPENPEFARYSGLKAVGGGALSCMGIIDFLPDGVDDGSPEIALCGKGITFDSGGYDIKPERFMEDMRTDKTGAVNLGAALALAIGLGLKRHVRAYLACAQNLVGYSSMVPGDILEYPNGLKIEVNNTDAEGRLVLADALLQARDDGARFILDAATLTGSAKYAVGRDMCCVFSRDNQISKSFLDAFQVAGELYWQLPMYRFHRRFLKSRRADMSNSGTGTSVPGASAAASFLRAFAGEETPWIHVDLSSAYLPDGSPFLGAGPTGALIVPAALWMLSEAL